MSDHEKGGGAPAAGQGQRGGEGHVSEKCKCIQEEKSP